MSLRRSFEPRSLRRGGLLRVACTLCALACATTAAAEEPASLESAIKAVQPIVNLRLRFEQVDQDGIAEQANAITLRGRLGFETGKFWGTTLLAEGEGTWPLQSDYNSTVNGKTQFPVVADPESYEVNRLALANTSLPDTTITLGRQRITQDNQRFVGPSDWRQNEQTFDALRIANHSVKHLSFDLTYLNQVNRVFGKDSPVGRYTGDTYLANIAYELPVGKLTAFGYLLDFKEAPTDSTTTAGLRYALDHTFSGVKLVGFVSFASQKDRGSNPLDFSNDYFGAELIATLREWSLGAGIEVLEGDGVKGFSTPLATLHKFQGWADKFLTTPANGIDDRYASLGYAVKALGLDSFSATAVYHRFQAQNVSMDYGSEVDAVVQAKQKRWSGMLKYAKYNADRFATDTSKFWVQFEFIY
jgi:hypothetical protein